MQQRAVKTKNSILDAAQEAFSLKGFAGTSIDEIARKADVNKQRIYAYFGSKRLLFEACLQQLFARMEFFSSELLEEAERSPGELTRLLWKGYFQVHERYPSLWRMLAWSNLEEIINEDFLKLARARENSRIRQIFDRAITEKKLREVDFGVYLLTIMATAYFCHSNRKTLSLTVGLPDFDKIAEELHRSFTDGSV